MIQTLVNNAYATLRALERKYPREPILTLLHSDLDILFDAAAPRFPGVTKPNDGDPKPSA